VSDGSNDDEVTRLRKEVSALTKKLAQRTDERDQALARVRSLQIDIQERETSFAHRLERVVLAGGASRSSSE
jgi:hypothetical protein